MHNIKLDLNHGAICVGSTPLEVREKHMLIGAIAKLCSPPIHITQGLTRYRFLSKVSVLGQPADGVIDIGNGSTFAVTFLFDLIEHYESSILESKIIKAVEKSSNLKFLSIHPSTALLDPCKWGSATFFYDAKQGDLSLEIKFERGTRQ